jgi:SAM-dependent methyltransferase
VITGRIVILAVRRATESAETSAIVDRARSQFLKRNYRDPWRYGMLAELMERTGNWILGDLPPDGKDYWAGRFWDRAFAEEHPVLGDHYRAQKAEIADLLKTYGGDVKRVIEFACGTGEFTAAAATHTPASEITAVDISAEGLRRTAARVSHPGLNLVEADFWKVQDLGTADLVMCVDAIHHIGNPRVVLERMRSFMVPGGLFVGNLWTSDHFHELQRHRYGNVAHLRNMASFLGTAMLVRASSARLHGSAYRTRLLPSKAVESVLKSVFSEVLYISPAHHHFVAFACRSAA